MPALSVIIVSYKCLDFLLDCLGSLLEATDECQIIVVDNASGDGTGDVLRRDYPDVTVIENDSNVGFPAANNQGLEIAEAENILLLNPDTIVTKGAIQSILTFMQRDALPKIAGPMVCSTDGSLQNTVHLEMPRPLRFVGEQIGILQDDASRLPAIVSESMSEPSLVAWVSGAALVFNRGVIERIGHLDERMFWAEDLDFCYRARAAGIPVYYLPGARIIHYGGESGKQNYRRMIYAQYSSRVAFAKKHFGRSTELTLRAAFGMILPLKMGIRLLQMPLSASRREKRDRLAGYWDAWRVCLPQRLGGRTSA
ncbi:MAG TPA: glycosyltransferase family 2 protein [Gemmatimonadaceae bacterium]|nr:glycosyltransferase family 2 protein [Gemmatimonadaceae bacterium]